MADDAGEPASRSGGGWQRFLEMWLTDILGILAPGFYFLILLSAVVILVAWLGSELGAGWDPAGPLKLLLVTATAGEETPTPLISGQIAVAGWVAVIVVSYVLGFLLYRQDPKRPDSMGFLRGYASSEAAERVQWVDYPDCPLLRDKSQADHANARCHEPHWRLCPLRRGNTHCGNRGNGDGTEQTSAQGGRLRRTVRLLLLWCWAKIRGLIFNGVHLFVLPPDCWRVEFPYRQLRRYLLARRMPSLAAMVRWGWRRRPSRGDESGKDLYEMQDTNRSKHFINRIKDWIRCERPDEYSEIGRNEAQVRLICSVWYATKAAAWVFLVYTLFVLSASPVMALVWLDRVGLDWGLISCLIFGLFALYLLGWVKAKIERFIHYQRVREVTKILFMADFVRNAFQTQTRSSAEVWAEAPPRDIHAEAGKLVLELEKHEEAPGWLRDIADGNWPPEQEQ